MNEAIIVWLNKFPVCELERVAKIASLSLKIEDGKITGYKHIENPHTDR